MTSQKPKPERVPLLLVGHGTRDPRGQEEFLELAKLVAERLPEVQVRPAYLELAAPDIGWAIDDLLTQSPARQLFVLPLLLFAASHAKRDIPGAVATALKKHPGVEARQLPHLGTHPAVVELSARRMAEVLAGGEIISAEETCGVLVGRGSFDAEALAEWVRFAERRRATTKLGRWESCFLAMARPTPDEILPKILAGSWRRIVWQPHLLFQGELSDRVREFVAAAAARDPARDWRIAAHLGPDPELAKAVAEMVRRETARL